MVLVLIRLLIIIAAFLLASLVTGYVVYGALYFFPTGGVGQDAETASFSYGLLIAMFVAMFAAMPASCVIALGEFKSWRMWWYYAIAGSAIGLMLGSMFSPPDWFPWLGLGFGPVAGAIYWSIAGRRAGLEGPNLRLTIVGIMIVLALLFTVGSWGSVVNAFF